MLEDPRPVYLDCNASTPVEPSVLEAMMPWFSIEPGNPSSWAHEYGQAARTAIEEARRRVAEVADSRPSEVLFTSGATEANNMALFSLGAMGKRSGRTHIVSTMIEHSAVLEPLRAIEAMGVGVTLVRPESGGWVDPDAIGNAITPRTCGVSVMHVNNETGVIQPIEEIATVARGAGCAFHTDAAQGFGKDVRRLQCAAPDLISISAHKLYGPKGVGALIVRRDTDVGEGFTPLMYGGGQERGMRPGTVPTPLVVGLGAAAERAMREHAGRTEACLAFKRSLRHWAGSIGAVLLGDQARAMANAAAVSFPGLSSRALLVALRPWVAVATGSACTAEDSEGNHVLAAMGISEESRGSVLRFSWCHRTTEPDWDGMARAVKIIS